MMHAHRIIGQARSGKRRASGSLNSSSKRAAFRLATPIVEW